MHYHHIRNIFFVGGAIGIVLVAHFIFDTHVARAALTQNNYRWYYNADTTDPTAAIAAENTDPAIGAATSTPMHLRMNVTTTGSAIATGTQALQLQSAFSTSGPWANVTDPWLDGSLSHRRKITVGSTTAALTDFPLAVFLYSSSTAGNLINNIDYSRTQNSGQDIRFATASGTPLQYQIEKWSETGTSTIWVKIPSIATSTWPGGVSGAGMPRQASSTYIWMYYGNTATTSAATTTGVWDSNYVGVWHLSEATGNHNDSVANGVNSSAITVGTQGATTTGIIDGGDNFTANTNNIVIPDNARWDLTGNFTIEAWVNGADEDTNSVYQAVVSRSDGGGDWDYTLLISAQTAVPSCYYSGITEFASSVDVTANQWAHVACTYDGTNKRIFVNGAQTGTLSGSPGNTDVTTALNIGEVVSGNQSYVGRVDEVRISNSARPIAWLDAQYRSTSNPNFNQYGPEESYATSTAWRFANATSTRITIDNATTTTLLLTGSDYNESYEEASTTPGFLKGLAANEDGEFDFYLDPAQATTTTTYYFRLIRATSTAALETYTNYPTITVGATTNPTFTQRNFQWFLNANNVQPGSVKSSLNATTTDVDNGSLHRLRMDVSVATANLSANGQIFDLQYRAAGTGCDTTGTWINVGGATSSAIWIMYDNTEVSPTSTISSLLLNSSNIAQTYSEVETFINPTAINSGQVGEWDWGILNNGATADTVYCFRIAKAGGTALDTYTNYPKLKTSSITGGRGGGASTSEIRPPETPSTGATVQSGGTSANPVTPSETPTTGGTGQGGGGDSAYTPAILRSLANLIEGLMSLVRLLKER